MADVNILLVENDHSYAKELEALLLELGYGQIDHVTDASQAKEKINYATPDIVIANVLMPNLQMGLELAHFILDRKIPVILITASNDPDIYTQARAALPVAYLVKPFDGLSLQAAIERSMVEGGHPMFVAQVLEAWHRERLVKDYIFVRRRSSLVKLRISDIDYIEADGNYCYLFESKNKHAIKISLKSLKQALRHSPFIQVNRSILLNFHRIKTVSFSEAKVDVGARIFTIGATYRGELEEWLNRP